MKVARQKKTDTVLVLKKLMAEMLKLMCRK